jgi:PleD family two-component response regulator
MDNNRLLIVEDDLGVADTLRDYFAKQGYEVKLVAQGKGALDYCAQQLPDLVLLNTTLLDVDGYTVCRELRAATRTSLIPIIFLSEERSLDKRVAGLEAGADDYVVKPFDIDELHLRVKAAIRAHQHFSMTDPKTNLPSGRLIEEQLRKLVGATDWVLLYIGVDNVASFNTEYGFVAGDEALRFAGDVIQDTVTQFGTLDDFVGRASNEVFLVISRSGRVPIMVEELGERFEKGAQLYYKAEHREQGGIPQPGGSLAPLMSFSIGVVSDKDGPFYDIHEITQAAAKKRRADQRRDA